MPNRLEATPAWVQTTQNNADVMGAHERTMFLHRVAVMGALTLKSVLQGEEKVGKTDPIEWGLLHSLGPKKEWAPYFWESYFVNVGEVGDRDDGFTHEFMTLSIRGTLETRTRRNLLGGKIKEQQVKDEEFSILRYLGKSAASPIVLMGPLDERQPYIDRGYTARDVRHLPLWSTEGQLRDYESRAESITEFMDSLQIIANAAQQPINASVLCGEAYDSSQLLSQLFDTPHLWIQMRDIKGVPNRNSVLD